MKRKVIGELDLSEMSGMSRGQGKDEGGGMMMKKKGWMKKNEEKRSLRL